MVALSGYSSAEHRERAYAAGFDEHIAKPMAIAQLEAVVARVRDGAPPNYVSQGVCRA